MCRNVGKLFLVALIGLLGWQAHATTYAELTFSDASEVSIWGRDNVTLTNTHDAVNGTMDIVYTNDGGADPFSGGFETSDAMLVGNWIAPDATQFAMRFTITGAPETPVNYEMNLAMRNTADQWSHAYIDEIPLVNGDYVVRIDLSTLTSDGRSKGAGNYTGNLNRVIISLPFTENPWASWQPVTIKVDWIAVTDDAAYVPAGEEATGTVLAPSPDSVPHVWEYTFNTDQTADWEDGGETPIDLAWDGSDTMLITPEVDAVDVSATQMRLILDDPPRPDFDPFWTGVQYFSMSVTTAGVDASITSILCALELLGDSTIQVPFSITPNSTQLVQLDLSSVSGMDTIGIVGNMRVYIPLADDGNAYKNATWSFDWIAMTDNPTYTEDTPGTPSASSFIDTMSGASCKRWKSDEAVTSWDNSDKLVVNNYGGPATIMRVQTGGNISPALDTSVYRYLSGKFDITGLPEGQKYRVRMRLWDTVADQGSHYWINVMEGTNKFYIDLQNDVFYALSDNGVSFREVEHDGAHNNWTELGTMNRPILYFWEIPYFIAQNITLDIDYFTLSNQPDYVPLGDEGGGGGENHGLIYTFDEASDVANFASGYAACPVTLTHDAGTGEMVVAYDYSTRDTDYSSEIDNSSASWNMDQFKYFSMKFTVQGYVPSDDGFIVRTYLRRVSPETMTEIDSAKITGDGTYVLRYDLSTYASYSGMGNRIVINLPRADQYPDWANATTRIDWIAITDDPNYEPAVSGGTITSDPEGGVGTSGSSMILAAPEGTDYQWYKDGVLIDGATSQTLVFEPITDADAGTYTCQYNNGSQTVTTDEFELTVVPPLVLPVAGFIGLAALAAISLIAGVAKNKRN